MRSLLVLVVMVACASGQEAPGDWPQWRGPRADGISRETGWQAKFPPSGPSKLWEVKLGRGHSSVVLGKGRLYTLSLDGTDTNREIVWCLDARTGKQIWKHSYAIETIRRGSNPAGGTPTVVGDVVYTYGAAMNLHALDAGTGKVLWARDLMKELPGQGTSYGFQISPVVHQDLVILPALAGRGIPRSEPRAGPYPASGGILLALDRRTGKEVWRNTEGASPWSTPVVTTIEGKPTLVHLTGKLILAVDPSSGKTRWKYNPADAGLRGLDVAAAPLIEGNQIIAPVHDGPGARPPQGYSTLCLKVQNDKPELLWKSPEWAHWFQSGVVWKGHVYGFDERSTFSCLDLADGKRKWNSRAFGTTGANGGGFLLADGKVLAIDARGKLTIAEVTPESGKILGQASVLETAGGYQCETAPVLLGGLLYCRNHTQLVCYDLRENQP